MIGIKSWVLQAERVQEDDGYTYADLARDMVQQLGWTGALDVATGLRSYVYGQPGGSDLHKTVEPLYRCLGWQQSALVACWFRDFRNRPGAKQPPKGRPRGWPTAAPAPRTSERSECR